MAAKELLRTDLIMGLLTDYFAATPEQAMECVERGPLGTTLPHVELKWVEPTILLGRLWAHVAEAEYDLDEFDARDDDVAFLDDEGPWITRIKERCTNSLAAIREAQVLTVAAKWSEAEEWIGLPEPSELAHVVRELATVARAATASERHLYVWMCL